MQVVEEHSHHLGLESLKLKGLTGEVRDLVKLPSLGMTHGAVKRINREFRGNLSNSGWAIDVRVHSDFRIQINGTKKRVGVTLQTGNITRAFYDLLKFEVMHKANRIDSAVLIVPSVGAAHALGSNLANFRRITTELSLFQEIITVPCLVLGIDESQGGENGSC